MKSYSTLITIAVLSTKIAFSFSLHQGIMGNPGEAQFQMTENYLQASSLARGGAGVAASQNSDSWLNPAFSNQFSNNSSEKDGDTSVPHSRVIALFATNQWSEKEFGFDYQSQFLNIPMGLFVRSQAHSIETKDINNNSLGDNQSWTGVFGFRIATPFENTTNEPRWGLQVKLIQDQIYQDTKRYGLLFDLGMQMPSQNAGWKSGFSILDIGQTLNCTQNCSENQFANTRFIWGNQLKYATFRKVTFMADGEIGLFSPMSINTALDWNIHPSLVARFGKKWKVAQLREWIQNDLFDSPTPKAPQDPLWFSTGFGFVWNQFTLDYSLQIGQGAVGLLHQSDIQWRF